MLLGNSRSTYLKENLCVAASVYLNREASQESIYFLWKYYSREYFHVKIPHSKIFQWGYLFSGGSTYLLGDKYWRSSLFPVNNYWVLLFYRGVLINGYTGGLIHANLLFWNSAVQNKSWLRSFISNKQSLFKRYGGLMTTFPTNLYFISSNVSSVILNSLSRNCFTIKSNFYFYFKKFRTLHKNNRNQHIK